MMSKPLFEVDVSSSAQSSLEAHSLLAAIDPSTCHHLARRLRLPLGIYNVSLSRISERLLSLCKRLEAYFTVSVDINALATERERRTEIVDFMELAIYAAAEHVDDIDSIAKGFFGDRKQAKRDAAYRQLSTGVERHKRYLSAAANAIKHGQARLRLYSCEFRQPGVRSCLHGYFVEGVENGAVGPNKLFHKDQEPFSVTTLVWEIITFVLQCSRDLKVFLSSRATLLPSDVEVPSDRFAKAVIAAARLPLYSFGEEHPFSRSTVRILTSSNGGSDLESGLYGSIKAPWSVSPPPVFGPDRSEYEGDGCSRQFRVVQPKNVSFHQWQ